MSFDYLLNTCKEVGLRCDRHESEAGEPGTEVRITIQVPAGRETRRLTIWNEADAESAADALRHYRFIAGLEAIWSLQLSAIEAAVEPGMGTRSWFLERFANVLDSTQAYQQSRETPDDFEPEANPRRKVSSVQISGAPWCERVIIGDPTTHCSSMLRRGRLTLRAEGIECRTHDDAKNAIVSIADALFFQTDLASGTFATLVAERRPFRVPYRSTKAAAKATPALDSVYDRDAMSLYWYARSARGMPLLEFLSFYQILERYFPEYARREAIQHVLGVTRSPMFDRHSNRDAARIVDVVVASLPNSGTADERSQLKSVIRGLVSEEAARDFLSQNERKSFFESKEAKKVSAHTLNLANRNIDVRESLAERVYDIRCRIVHSKAQSVDRRPLLQFSQELALLDNDIDIVRFVATQAVVKHAGPVALRAMEPGVESAEQ